MANGWTLLVKDNFKAWVGARGFWTILLTALVPPLLTGAWVLTHQTDINAGPITWESDELVEGDNVTITAQVRNDYDRAAHAQNATLRIGFYQQNFRGIVNFVERAATTQRIEPLEPGQSRSITLDWTTEPGNFLVELLVDTEDELPEIEERNNFRQAQLPVQFAPRELDLAPQPEGNETRPQADARVVSLDWEPTEFFHGERANFTLTLANNGPNNLTNATANIQVHQVTPVGAQPMPSPSLDEIIDLAVGEEETFRMEWSNVQLGQYAVVAVFDTPQNRDPSPSDNVVVQEFTIDRRLIFEEPDPKATAKDFYGDVLANLHFALLIPLIALFYAGGALEDERERGNLPYLLTRPIPRSILPLARFATTFVVSGIAILVGILATFLVLLGTPQETPGFLYWPLLFSGVVLWTYGGLATLLGVTVRKPYLVGLLYIIGLEALILVGQNILVNDQPILQDWVLNFSLNHWVGEAFAGWDKSATGLQYLPEGEAARNAFLALLVIGGAAIAASAWWMRKREFQE